MFYGTIVCPRSPEPSFLVNNSCYMGQLPKHLVVQWSPLNTGTNSKKKCFDVGKNNWVMRLLRYSIRMIQTCKHVYNMKTCLFQYKTIGSEYGDPLKSNSAWNFIHFTVFYTCTRYLCKQSCMANPLLPSLQHLARCLHQLEIISASEKVFEADCINYRSLTIFVFVCIMFSLVARWHDRLAWSLCSRWIITS